VPPAAAEESADRPIPVYCSWSGGKDSALALHRAIEDGAEPRLLVTMMTEAGERSRSHGLSRELLREQAAALGMPISFTATSWADYEEAMGRTLKDAVAQGLGDGVFGDIDTQRHRDWVEAVAEKAGSRAWLPLWQSPREALMHELLELGFRPVLVAVRDGLLEPSLLGRVIDREMLEHFSERGVDLAGENGEYHTFVAAGPIFERPVEVEVGETSLRDGVWFADLLPRQRSSNGQEQPI